MIVSYAATRNLYEKMLPSIKSLLDHNDVERIYILCEDDDFPYEIPCDVISINVSGQRIFNDINTHTCFTYMSLMRLLLADLTSEERIIYLDCDTIILDDLTPIWTMDMDGKWWGAVEETQGIYHPFGKHYYNAGVSVFNLKQMREDGAVKIMVDDLNRLNYRFPDQDILNKLCVPYKLAPIETRYNESFCCGQTKNPAIIHYAGYGDWWENPRTPRFEYLRRYKDNPPCPKA